MPLCLFPSPDNELRCELSLPHVGVHQFSKTTWWRNVWIDPPTPLTSQDAAALQRLLLDIAADTYADDDSMVTLIPLIATVPLTPG
jgi:hypothetical protein